ncbi:MULTISPECIES: 2,3,4,5-tetrahydropyridine-2,6-dicarboxylate N-acetyltransferase [Tissierellales]|jgi:2,3,4,5-tetrahydropyridine-2-carboxylate N-succinyltransferase|uniref:2,3,4,5-tetrahydropyridine-2,6-dicarboxylate N-acetyltransferase n=1 Tax=Acidilutibacter cellobiosedens TaxID=2507161 RepID=A0A410QBI9_9FIRM|nr:MULTISPECIES: 2,3,4,5-tetrahydropyridine-2,6-dicarboxylate N-acetyltransferase [Tissierellales]MBE6082160.1 2,3,4,5-tetrahydropyridine-2,6-dicarboxylate N-acetyltransferase [Tissierellaceae bacterium]QAT61320.1 2,3,4,5-tetrahydropyridine-2,6-dicarboxylate N-acetyltransferase [Acidilutibacter cellobiosedens]SCL95098.1 2,3,4,5-tetrahydropyridine-2,6-dicarboxylate N-acetyltransferase [Sporanaerobacter sp. PP17-6a]
MTNDKDFLDDPYKIAQYLKNSQKTTPIKAYVRGNIDNMDLSKFKHFGNNDLTILIGEWADFKDLLEKNGSNIYEYYIENNQRNSAIPLLDIKDINARIEPGAIIRDMVHIGNKAVIMMGAVINIGAVIGDYTMIDMNTVIGSRAQIGKNVHVGAGAVIAGLLEPPNKTPVIIEDEVLIGANAVVLEGVRVGKGSVVAAGSVVTMDVPPNSVVAGIPAKFIKEKDNKTKNKTAIVKEIRE